MPKLWNDTIEQHRRSVRDAILDAAAVITRQQGVAAVTMSAIASKTRIGRATLYKYFPDLNAILLAWHERQVGRHMHELTAIFHDGDEDPLARLDRAFEAYATMARGQDGTDVSALLHAGPHVAKARRHLRDLFRTLIEEAAEAGQVRGDMGADELALYCLGAVGAASGLKSKAAVRRLIDVTISGIKATPKKRFRGR